MIAIWIFAIISMVIIIEVIGAVFIVYKCINVNNQTKKDFKEESENESKK